MEVPPATYLRNKSSPDIIGIKCSGIVFYGLLVSIVNFCLFVCQTLNVIMRGDTPGE